MGESGLRLAVSSTRAKRSGARRAALRPAAYRGTLRGRRVRDGIHAVTYTGSTGRVEPVRSMACAPSPVFWEPRQSFDCRCSPARSGAGTGGRAPIPKNRRLLASRMRASAFAALNNLRCRTPTQDGFMQPRDSVASRNSARRHRFYDSASEKGCQDNLLTNYKQLVHIRRGKCRGLQDRGGTKSPTLTSRALCCP